MTMYVIEASALMDAAAAGALLRIRMHALAGAQPARCTGHARHVTARRPQRLALLPSLPIGIHAESNHACAACAQSRVGGQLLLDPSAGEARRHDGSALLAMMPARNLARLGSLACMAARVS